MGTVIITDGVTVDARYGGLDTVLDGEAYYTAGAGRLIPNVRNMTTPTTSTATTNAIRIAPWGSPLDFTTDQATINVTTGIATAVVHVVVYSSDNNGRPDKLLFESDAIDCSAIATKTVAMNFTFKRGVQYWVGIRGNLNPVLSAHAAISAATIECTSVALINKCISKIRTYAAGPLNPWAFVAADGNSALPFCVWFRTT